MIKSSMALDFLEKPFVVTSEVTFSVRTADSNFSFSLILGFEVPDVLSRIQHIVIFIY